MLMKLTTGRSEGVVKCVTECDGWVGGKLVKSENDLFMDDLLNIDPYNIALTHIFV